MRRLPGIIMALFATLIVVVALVVSGLRLALPHLDTFRPKIIETLNRHYAMDIRIREMHGSWQSFGPTLDIGGIDAVAPNEQFTIQRVTVALDIWQSLLHWRLQFRDVTFYRLNLSLNGTLLGRDNQGSPIKADRMSDLFLYQFDHFILRDSQLSFLTPSGERSTLSIPQLTWLNGRDRHRAEGQVSLSSVNVQQGAIDVRMDLHDEKGLLDKGRVYLQADGIDLKPWFSQLLQSNTGLTQADFSLAAWLSIKDGDVDGADVFLNQGRALWHEQGQDHRVDVNKLALHLTRQNEGWHMAVPRLNIATDGDSWADGKLSLFWQPEKNHLFAPDKAGEIRLRASNLELERFSAFLPLFSSLTPHLRDRWNDLAPKGHLATLAMDIPLNDSGKTRFAARWRDVAWQQWQLLPGADNVSGMAAGTAAAGQISLALTDSTLPYKEMFRAPLDVSSARVNLEWTNDASGLVLAGKDLDIQARALWATGDFRFHKPAAGQPWLDILSGMRLTDAAQAWRYFPEPLMGTHLVDYLTGALKGGTVDNATLVFAGNPSQFPFKHNDGQFEVWVPLRQATYEFEPGWPALTNLAINLDFLNDGLFMDAPQTRLGEATGKNIVATIPDYSRQKLLVDADISGQGSAIRDYFYQTPLKNSLGKTLDQLKVGGNVNGTLHLDIPLTGQQPVASGKVNLAGNSLFVTALGTGFKDLSGQFRYSNGNLESDTLKGNWFGQPVAIDFTSTEHDKGFDIDVGLRGDWALNRLSTIPPPLASALGGQASWQSDIAIALPLAGNTTYQVEVKSDLKNVSSHLPEPLDKAQGQAFPVTVNVRGDLNAFRLSGHAGESNAFNSEFLLARQLTLARGAWNSNGTQIPSLPEDRSLSLSLPALNGEKWLALMMPLSQSAGKSAASRFRFPDALALSTPALTLGGQRWHDLTLTRRNIAGGTRVDAKGQEIAGTLSMIDNGIWRAALDYLYYNPEWPEDKASAGGGQTDPLPDAERLKDFSGWPAVQWRCKACWVKGQNFGQVDADLTPQRNTLTLTDGLVDTGKARLVVEGGWTLNGAQSRTSLKGKLSGKSISVATDYLGYDSPLRDSPFDIDLDLHWQDVPWSPQLSSLNGVLHSSLGKGKIDNISSGQAGRLLRLISFDALLRKLQFDFRDAFGQGFYFDSIKGSAWLKGGTLHTSDLLVDGLEADIAMSGDVDFTRQQIDMKAVITPEVSATVGVATAFAINPVVGAAVFAASKVLAPLWSKISLIRYRITGPLDQPVIEEELRQPRQPGDGDK